jgi:hypothetical protein
MNINITVPIDQEEEDALNQKASDAGFASISELLTAIVVGEISVVKQAAYEASTRRIGEAFKEKPYQERLQIIAMLEGQL